MPDINSSKFAQQFNVTIRGLETLVRMSKKDIPKLNVCVPDDEMAHIRTLWKDYEKVLKENRHRKVVNKLRNLTNLGTDKFKKQETKRLGKLLEVFQKTDDYMHEAKDFFINCRQHKEIEKYVKQIDEDYKTLFDKKGYLQGKVVNGSPHVIMEAVGNYVRHVGDANDQTNAHLDRNRFMVLGKPTAQDPLPAPVVVGHNGNEFEMDYAFHVSYAYTRLYTLVNNFCQSADNFVTFLEQTKDRVDGWRTAIDDEVDEIRDYYKKFRECVVAVESLKAEVDSCDDAKVQGNYKQLCENLRFWTNKFDRIDKKSTTTYIESVFYNAIPAEHTQIMNMTGYILDCAAELDSFAKGITSGDVSATGLRNYLGNAVKNYRRMTAILTSHTQHPQHPPQVATVSFRTLLGATPQFLEAQRKTINDKYAELQDNLDELGEAFRKFGKEQTNFINLYSEWKTEQIATRRRTALFAVFAVFGLLTTGLQVFNPLIEGAIMRMPAPVAPLPTTKGSPV